MCLALHPSEAIPSLAKVLSLLGCTLGVLFSRWPALSRGQQFLPPWFSTSSHVVQATTSGPAAKQASTLPKPTPNENEHPIGPSRRSANHDRHPNKAQVLPIATCTMTRCGGPWSCGIPSWLSAQQPRSSVRRPLPPCGAVCRAAWGPGGHSGAWRNQMRCGFLEMDVVLGW